MNVELITPVVTVLDADGNLHQEGNRALYNHVIEGGVDGILLAGSAGEFCAFTMQQMRSLVDDAVTTIAGRVPLLVGTGRTNLAETIELSNYALGRGATGVLVVNPYYFVLDNDALLHYYGALAQAVKGQVYIYNYPAGTGRSIPPHVVAQLANQHKNIAGIKDSVADFGHARDILLALRTTRPDFKVYSGYDDNFMHNAFSGGSGVMSALSNIAPTQFSAWVRAVKEKDLTQMQRWQRYFDEFMGLYALANPFMPTMKRALVLLGVIPTDCCSFPLQPLPPAQEEKLQALLRSLALLQ